MHQLVASGLIPWGERGGGQMPVHLRLYLGLFLCNIVRGKFPGPVIMSQPEITPSTKLRLDRKLTRPGRQSGFSALLILTTISVSNVNGNIHLQLWAAWSLCQVQLSLGVWQIVTFWWKPVYSYGRLLVTVMRFASYWMMSTQ